ncbi:tyrosine--tRNA ligase [Elysia marginata]|uniref:Tyrosine--tRNA ligase n=1 Tax=Elysia marginata TaxID=1093978 RepID=A0AAV4G741_9GAST|nr:tyrosine--tRNA ligase [Elysia marginata]
MKWRGLLHNTTPDTADFLASKKVKGYIGFDPTSDSLHIGSLLQLIILKHFQNSGHQPVVLIGGATGMVGDPSGKSKERNLLTEEQLSANIKEILRQIDKYVDFERPKNPAILVNNYDWMKPFSLIDFVRDIGKHITVNYMMAKDSVKKRISTQDSEGMSFTEFTYQLFQGYDFLHLYENNNCKLQMGGSDQWGNITTGIELIRRKTGGRAHGLTIKLLKKADGNKFGKTEQDNIWLDPEKTSPYKFYQYWINSSDEDAENFIKIFTFLDRETIKNIVSEHREKPHLRLLQKHLAKEVTTLVHSKQEWEKVQRASEILFGKATESDLKKLDERTFADVFEGIPRKTLPFLELNQGMDMILALSVKTGFLNSNSEAIRNLKDNAISVNKKKVDSSYRLSKRDLINGKYILLQRGKRHYFILHFD